MTEIEKRVQRIVEGIFCNWMLHNHKMAEIKAHQCEVKEVSYAFEPTQIEVKISVTWDNNLCNYDSFWFNASMTLQGDDSLKRFLIPQIEGILRVLFYIWYEENKPKECKPYSMIIGSIINMVRDSMDDLHVANKIIKIGCRIESENVDLLHEKAVLIGIDVKWTDRILTERLICIPEALMYEPKDEFIKRLEILIKDVARGLTKKWEQEHKGSEDNEVHVI